MKPYRGCGDSFLVSHEAVCEMTSGRQIQTHDSIVRIQKTGVHRKVGWGTAVRLNLVDHKTCIVHMFIFVEHVEVEYNILLFSIACNVTSRRCRLA